MARPVKKVDPVVTSGDSAKTSDVDPSVEAVVETSVAAGDAPLFTPGVDAPVEVKEVKPKSPKASRRAKTCERCDERRKREREYARVSRDRARAARIEKKGETATEPEKASEKPEPETMKTSE
jgi:hypothetical protein